MGLTSGKKVFLGANTTPFTVSTYYTAQNEFKVTSGWRNSIGALFRLWQWYDGAGDRLFDNIIVYPLGHDGSSNFQAVGSLNPQLALTAVAPAKPQAGDLVETFTTIISTVSGSPVITRSSGSFDPALARPGLGISAATGIALGSIIKRVLSTTELELDRNAIGATSGITARTFKPPAVCKLGRLFWHGNTPPTAPWPVDGIQFGFHTAAGGTADLTGIVFEAWPLFDDAETSPNVGAWDVPGLGSY